MTDARASRPSAFRGSDGPFITPEAFRARHRCIEGLVVASGPFLVKPEAGRLEPASRARAAPWVLAAAEAEPLAGAMPRKARAGAADKAEAEKTEQAAQSTAPRMRTRSVTGRLPHQIKAHDASPAGGRGGGRGKKRAASPESESEPEPEPEPAPARKRARKPRAPPVPMRVPPDQAERVLTLVAPFASPRVLLALAGVSRLVREHAVEEREARVKAYKAGTLVERWEWEDHPIPTPGRFNSWVVRSDCHQCYHLNDADLRGLPYQRKQHSTYDVTMTLYSRKHVEDVAILKHGTKSRARPRPRTGNARQQRAERVAKLKASRPNLFARIVDAAAEDYLRNGRGGIKGVEEAIRVYEVVYSNTRLFMSDWLRRMRYPDEYMDDDYDDYRGYRRYGMYGEYRPRAPLAIPSFEVTMREAERRRPRAEQVPREAMQKVPEAARKFVEGTGPMGFGERYAQLTAALAARGCELRSDSRLCKDFLVHGGGASDAESIAVDMEEMKWIFAKHKVEYQALMDARRQHRYFVGDLLKCSASELYDEVADDPVVRSHQAKAAIARKYAATDPDAPFGAKRRAGVATGAGAGAGAQGEGSGSAVQGAAEGAGVAQGEGSGGAAQGAQGAGATEGAGAGAAQGVVAAQGEGSGGAAQGVTEGAAQGAGQAAGAAQGVGVAQCAGAL